MDKKSKFQSILEDRFPHIKSYIKDNNLDKLAEDVIDDGVYRHSEEIYGGKMDAEERSFFFYYLINQAITRCKFKFAGDMHRNFIKEMVGCGNTESLEIFLRTAVKPSVGAFSYAAEIAIDELKIQIAACTDDAVKSKLEQTLVIITAEYDAHKAELKENWEYVQSLEDYNEIKEAIATAAIRVLKIATVGMAVFLVVKFLS